MCGTVEGEGQGQIAPGTQAPRVLITSNAPKSGGPHKANQRYFFVMCYFDRLSYLFDFS